MPGAAGAAAGGCAPAAHMRVVVTAVNPIEGLIDLALAEED